MSHPKWIIACIILGVIGLSACRAEPTTVATIAAQVETPTVAATRLPLASATSADRSIPSPSSSPPTATPDVTPTPAPTATRLLLASATVTPVPTLPPIDVASILDRDRAASYSADLLRQQGDSFVSTTNSYNYAEIEFPNGDRGIVVALGTGVGPQRGRLMVFRVRGPDQVELVQQEQGSTNWGLWTTQRNGGQATLPEYLTFRLDSSGPPRTLLKLTGWASAGVGLLLEGAFTIFAVTDSGLRGIFNGAETSWVLGMEMGEMHRYQHQYADIDGDGRTEIVVQESICTVRYDQTTNSWAEEKTSCRTSTYVCYYDGTRYKSRQ